MLVIAARVTLKEGDITLRCPRHYVTDPKGGFDTWSTSLSEAHQFGSMAEAEDHMEFVSRDIASAMAEPCQIPLVWQHAPLLIDSPIRPYREGDQLELKVLWADGAELHAGIAASF